MGWRGVAAVGAVVLGAGVLGGAGASPAARPNGTPVVGGTPPALATPLAAEAVVHSLDVYFAPATLAIPADADVAIRLPNDGKALHSFTIDALGIDVYVAPGDEGHAVVNAPAGTYRYYCAVWGHARAGMVGALTVE